MRSSSGLDKKGESVDPDKSRILSYKNHLCSAVLLLLLLMRADAQH
jgi:hypothetical protein